MKRVGGLVFLLLFLSAPQSSAETSIPGGFSHHNVKAKSGMMEDIGGFQVIGEMTNKSGNDYKIMASFLISFYDKSDSLLTTGVIMMSNFFNGQTKSFSAIIMGAKIKNISRYKIQFENGM